MQPPSIGKLGIALVVTATSTLVIVASAYTVSSPFIEKESQNTPQPTAGTKSTPEIHEKIAPLKTVVTSNDSNSPNNRQLNFYSASSRNAHPPVANSRDSNIDQDHHVNSDDSGNLVKEKRGHVVRQTGNSSYAPGQVKKIKQN